MSGINGYARVSTLTMMPETAYLQKAQQFKDHQQQGWKQDKIREVISFQQTILWR